MLRYYTSPKSYTDLISLYTSLLAEKKTEYGEARDRLLNGLNKLQETNAVVDAMQAQLNQLQPVLEEKAQVRIVPRLLHPKFPTYLITFCLYCSRSPSYFSVFLRPALTMTEAIVGPYC